MTTIAGLVHAGRVWLAGDSAVTAESGEQWLQREPKVFVRGPVAIGVTGSSAWQNMLQELSPRRPFGGGDALAWLRVEISQRVIESTGFDRDRDEALLGFGGRLWVLEASGAIWAVAGTATAIGSGAGPARGVLRFTSNRRVVRVLQLGPRERLRAALEAAEACDANTRRPFRMVAT